jgi:branched-subunit amino acid ABC-type transport system permease component
LWREEAPADGIHLQLLVNIVVLASILRTIACGYVMIYRECVFNLAHGELMMRSAGVLAGDRVAVFRACRWRSGPLLS